MTRHTIDYGIDLGTTNSAIARADDGRSTIFKSPEYQKDTTPSIVHYARRSIVVGDNARKILEQELLAEMASGVPQRNTFLEFKRTMGTDTLYACSNTQRNLTPEELSSEVLKELRRQVADDDVRSAVITVPARFQQHQIDATQRAAEAAGFVYCELLQEPIAASLAYEIDSKASNGRWLVFDFGGGTFDAALMKTDGGLMKVIDTAGDEHLGGKNIDMALVDHLLMPYMEKKFPLGRQFADPARRSLWREVLKQHAEKAKIALATKSSVDVEIFPDPRLADDNGNTIDLFLPISLAEFEKVARPVMQRAIDISSQMLRSNRMSGKDLSTIVLVGGPTFSQTLRGMIADSISAEIAVGVDPMTAVARGAAFYAGMRQQPSAIRTPTAGKVPLTLRYASSTVETEELVGILIERASASATLPHDLYVELRRGDGGWTSGRVMVTGDSEVVPVILDENKVNTFSIVLYDGSGNALPTEPSQFSILSGLRAPSATLPYSLCLGALSTMNGRDELMVFSTLEKNLPLPAKGKGSFRTQKDMRPGLAEDAIKLPLYNGDNGSQCQYNNPLLSQRITGDDLPQFLPSGSEVEVTVSVDTSRRVAISAFFPYLDMSVDLAPCSYTQPDPEIEQLKRNIDSLTVHIASLTEGGFIPDSTKASETAAVQELSNTLKSGGTDSDTRRLVLKRLRELARKLDLAEKEGAWPAAERELTDALERFESFNKTSGTSESRTQLQSFQSQIATILESKKIDLAAALTSQVRQAHFAMVSRDPGYWMSQIKRLDDLFDAFEWSSPLYARQILDAVKQQIFRGTATVEVLESATRQLWELLPNSSQTSSQIANDLELLRK